MSSYLLIYGRPASPSLIYGRPASPSRISRLEKSALFKNALPTPCSKKDISLYTEYADTPGLSNNRIRLWFVPHTIYPYSLSVFSCFSPQETAHAKSGEFHAMLCHELRAEVLRQLIRASSIVIIFSLAIPLKSSLFFVKPSISLYKNFLSQCTLQSACQIIFQQEGFVHPNLRRIVATI